MSIIDDDHHPKRISESMDLDEYQLIDLPMEQPDGLSHEHTGIGMAPTLDTGSMSVLLPSPVTGVQWYCVMAVNPCLGQGSSLSSLLTHGYCTRGMKNEGKNLLF